MKRVLQLPISRQLFQASRPEFETYAFSLLCKHYHCTNMVIPAKCGRSRRVVDVGIKGTGKYALMVQQMWPSPPPLQ